jgi:hypothetical protein
MADGRGIPNTRISVVLPSGESKFTITNPFGFYHFDDIGVGQAYVFQASVREYTFSAPTQLVTVNDSVDNVNFVADGMGKGGRNSAFNKLVV